MINQKVAKRAGNILEIARKMAEKYSDWQVRSAIEGITLYFDGYAEPGYTDPGCGIIATGDWNDIPKWIHPTNNCDVGYRSIVSDLPSRVGNLFEKLGIECEWEDEWHPCSLCGKLIRKNADSYSWQPSYSYSDGEINCAICMEDNAEEYLENLEGKYDSCCVIEKIDPADYGYVKLNKDSFETGWHEGQTDNPKTIAKYLDKKGIGRYLFKLDEQSQFYSSWSVYVHESEKYLIEDSMLDTISSPAKMKADLLNDLA